MVRLFMYQIDSYLNRLVYFLASVILDGQSVLNLKIPIHYYECIKRYTQYNQTYLKYTEIF